MWKQRMVNDSFWTDPYIEDLDPSEKLLFLYLLTNPLCNIAWAYEIKIKRIAYETWYDKEMVDKILNRFVKDGKILREKDWIILVNFAKNQSNNPNTLKWMQRIIDSIPEPIQKALKGFESLPYFTLLNLTLPNLTLLNSKEGEKISDEISLTQNWWDIFKTISHEEVLQKYEISEEEFREEMQLFINYWTAPIQKWVNKWKPLWKTKETFVPSLRFSTWLSQNKKWNKKNLSSKPTGIWILD